VVYWFGTRTAGLESTRREVGKKQVATG